MKATVSSKNLLQMVVNSGGAWCKNWVFSVKVATYQILHKCKRVCFCVFYLDEPFLCEKQLSNHKNIQYMSSMVRFFSYTFIVNLHSNTLFTTLPCTYFKYFSRHSVLKHTSLKLKQQGTKTNSER
jgi:hypothetical protein